MPVGVRGFGLSGGEQYRVQEREQRTNLQRGDGSTGSYRQVLRLFSKESHRSMSLVSSGNYHEDAAGERIIQRDDLRVTCR